MIINVVNNKTRYNYIKYIIEIIITMFDTKIKWSRIIKIMLNYIILRFVICNH